MCCLVGTHVVKPVLLRFRAWQVFSQQYLLQQPGALERVLWCSMLLIEEEEE